MEIAIILGAGVAAILLLSGKAGALFSGSGTTTAPTFVPGSVNDPNLPGSLGGPTGVQITSAPTGTDAQGVQQASQVSGIAGVASKSIAAIPGLAGSFAIPIIGFGVALGTGIYSMIAQQHAEAIKREKTTLLSAVNHFYTLMDAVLADYNSNKMTRQQAINGVMVAYGIYISALTAGVQTSINNLSAGGVMKPNHGPAFWGQLGMASGNIKVVRPPLPTVTLPAALPPFRTQMPPWKGDDPGANGPYVNARLWILPAAGSVIRGLAYLAGWVPAMGAPQSGVAFKWTSNAMWPSTDFPGVAAHTFVILKGKQG